MPTIGNMDAATQAQVDAVDTVIAGENGAASQSFKMTVLQWVLAMLRPSKLAVVVTGDVTNTALFNLEDPALPAPFNRQVTIVQLRLLVAARTGQIHKFQSTPKVGATAGWVVGAANNQGKMATLPAGQAGSTLVIPIPTLKPGWTIQAWAINGSLQSAGNNCTILGDLRALTANAAGATDASIGVMAAALTVVANTILSVANATKAAIAHVVLAGNSYYMLITSTTAAATTQEIQSIDLYIDEA